MPTVTYPDGEVKTWGGLNRCLCYNCRNLFSSVSAFEKHQKRGNCLDPATVGLELKGGVWQYPGPAGGLRVTLEGAAKPTAYSGEGDAPRGGESADVTAKNDGAA